MKSIIVLCVVLAVCSAYRAPEAENHRSRRDTELIQNTGKLIQELVKNLANSAKEALNAAETFKSGIKDEVTEVRDKIQNNILKFRNRIQDAVENVMQRISYTSTAVKACVDSHRTAAAALFNNTLSSTMACVEERIADITGQIHSIAPLATEAMASGTTALEDMKKCTTNNSNIFSSGTCLGGIVFGLEVKTIQFMKQCAITIGRINVNLATLPAALEVCAAQRLIQTGIETGKLIMSVGTCSTTGLFNSIIGKPNV